MSTCSPSKILPFVQDISEYCNMSRSNHAELQFIPSSHPGTAPSRESQRRANAHAARVAHGRVRRFRVIEYQASQNSRKPKEKIDPPGSRLKRSRPQRSNGTAATASPLLIAEAGGFALANPVTTLVSARKESFAFFARSFSQIESYLVDYCKDTTLWLIWLSELMSTRVLSLH